MCNLFFSQIREDSLVERMISQHRASKNKNIVVIGSGGCTAFSILDDSVNHVYCVDLNPAQCALIELKKAALVSLDRKDYLAFIGELPCSNRTIIYHQLSAYLPEYAKQYWDRHPEDLEHGINQCGINERFYRFVGQNICSTLYDKTVWNELFSANHVNDQKRFFEKYLTASTWKTAVQILLSKTSHLQFFPAFMFANASEHDFGNYFLGQFEKEVTSRSVVNNYFISQILFASYIYDKEYGMPYYLTEEGYATAKRNVAKLSIIPLAIQKFLTEHMGLKHPTIDAFYLSNIFDWADEEAQVDICKSILDAKAKEAVVLYRNMLSVQNLPEFFRGALHIDQQLSEKSINIERSMVYQKITVGYLP